MIFGILLTFDVVYVALVLASWLVGLVARWRR
jgi:hypothetical protein